MEVDVSDFFCVDCGATNLNILSYDEEFNTRIATLALNVEDLIDRVEQLEWYSDDTGNDTTATKKATTLKN